MENLSLFDTKIAYTVKKLIAVNSISYCYVELDIDRHCALFGRNNLGKTSLLNALKLHFFPEISFNDCKKKFAFKSSKGELYSTEDSYRYYFPSDSSFLILEAENIHGAFCIILFKSNNSFGYQRLLLPCKYEAIREHFWDIENTECNKGLGSPVTDLGIAKIHVLHKQYQQQGAQILKTTKEIRERLFVHSPMNRDKGRYCLVPLKDGGMERELNAFRQLMNFTFEIAKTETKGLTETFATIIESGKINTQDRLHQDLQAILDEYQELRDTQDKLKAIANYGDQYKDLIANQQNYNAQNNAFGNQFIAYRSCLQKQQQHLKQEFAPAESTVAQLHGERDELENKLEALKSEYDRYEGQLKELYKAFQQYDMKAKRFQEIQQAYPESPVAVIEDSLKNTKEDLSHDLEQLQNKQKAAQALASLVAQQQQKISLQKQKQQVLQQQDKLLLNDLDGHSAQVLSNIHKRFTEMTGVAESVQKKQIQGFSALFTIKEDGLDFLEQSFISGKLQSAEDIRAQLHQEIEGLREEIKVLDAKISKSNQISQLTVQEQQRQLTQVTMEHDQVKQDLLIVQSIEETHLQWQAKKDDISQIEQQRDTLAGQQEESHDLLKYNQNALQKAREELKHLDRQLSETGNLLQKLDGFNVDELTSTEQLQVTSVSNTDISELAAQQKKVAHLKETLDQGINEFIQCGHFQLPVDMPYSRYNNTQADTILLALKNTFAELPEQQATLDSRIIGHNKTTGAKISELTGNRSHIRQFVNKINGQFGQYSISNLQDIHVEIALDHRFEALINELEQTNLNTTDIHDDGLYQRLNDFCNDFFTLQGNRVLEISKIIKNVKYSYKKAHQDKREDKDQSTGTNALINCTLLTILLSDLLAQESNLKIPIIFDEFTALDEFNQHTAIKAASQHGFALFCASPTDTAEVVAVVDYYIHLDDFHVNTLYDAKGERDVVFHHFQERLYNLQEQAS